MFQLIVAVVSILLIALLALAAIYYGGPAHNEAAIKAQYAANMNAAAQIEGAQQLYFQEHASNPPEDLKDEALLLFLQERGYLKEIPDGTWTVNASTLFKPTKFQTIEECRGMNRVAGFNVSAADLAPYDGCPPCNGVEGSPELALAEKYKAWPGCQVLQ